MSTYAFVIAVIAIVVIGRIVRHYMAIRHERPREDPDWQAKLDSLEKRVRTLETIVTDKGYELKREFERL